MKHLVCLSLFLALCSPGAFADDFHGRVLSEAGNPLSGVNVLDMPNQEVLTDSDGRFILQSVPRGALKVVDIERSVRFTSSGYYPITRVLSLNKDSEIVLRKDDRVAWTPTRCIASSATLRGDVMAFTLPQNSQVTRSQDVDYSAAAVSSGAHTVTLAWGAFWSWGIPGPSFFAGLSQLQERSLVLADDVTVAEYKGTRTDGSRFRYIGIYGETISYDGVDTPAAEYFDRIMDSLCWIRVPASTRPVR